MIEGIVRIYTSCVEPEDKNLLWLRPYLDKEGYQLLYYGSSGWAELYKSEGIEVPEISDDDSLDECPCEY